MIECAVTMLERLVARLSAGEVLPNATLGDVVEFLRELNEEGAAESEVSVGTPCVSGCVAQHVQARGHLHRMQWTLESLERGEAGAVGAFVISAREYIRAYRDHVRLDDSLFPKAAEAAADLDPLPTVLADASQTRDVVRRFNRMLERYWRLTPRAAVSTSSFALGGGKLGPSPQ